MLSLSRNHAAIEGAVLLVVRIAMFGCTWQFAGIILALGVCLYVFFWYWSKPSNLPPGPNGLPLLGCVPYIQPSTAHLTLEKWSRTYGGLMSFYMGSQLVVVLADYEAIKETLIRQGDAFNGRAVIKTFLPQGVEPGLGLTAAEGELWREQRRFCLNTLKDFGAGRSILEPRIRQEVKFLLEEIAKSDGEPSDVKLALHYAVSNVIVQLTFGRRFDYSDPEYISYLRKLTFRLSNSGVNAMSAFNFFPFILRLPVVSAGVERVLRDGVAILDFIRGFIRRKAAEFDADRPPEDYMDAFFKAGAMQEGRHFHQDQLLISVQQLFIAGAETTATTLRWALWYMAKYPQCQARIYEEICANVGVDEPPSWADHARMPYAEATLCEVQRLANLSPMSITHRTLCETTAMGYRIPREAYVIPLLWAVHRNPDCFPNPEQFQPERFLDENLRLIKHPALIPFSVGKRVCLGESLARMELFIFFSALIQRFKFSFPTPVKSDQPEVTVGVVISPKPFPLIASRRQ